MIKYIYRLIIIIIVLLIYYPLCFLDLIFITLWDFKKVKDRLENYSFDSNPEFYYYKSIRSVDDISYKTIWDFLFDRKTYPNRRKIKDGKISSS